MTTMTMFLLCLAIGIYGVLMTFVLVFFSICKKPTPPYEVDDTDETEDSIDEDIPQDRSL